jgi:hypothetical protein
MSLFVGSQYDDFGAFVCVKNYDMRTKFIFVQPANIKIIDQNKLKDTSKLDNIAKTKQISQFNLQHVPLVNLAKKQ